MKITTEDYGAILLRFRGAGEKTGTGSTAPGLEGGESRRSEVPVPIFSQARGVLWVSQVTAGRKNCLRLEVAGSKLAVAWESERPNEVWIGHRDRPNELLLRDPALVSDVVRPYVAFPGGHNEGFPDTFKQCFRAFYSYIRQGDVSASPTFPTFADGHREILLCEAIAASHRQRGWVDVGGGQP